VKLVHLVEDQDDRPFKLINKYIDPSLTIFHQHSIKKLSNGMYLKFSKINNRKGNTRRRVLVYEALAMSGGERRGRGPSNETVSGAIKKFALRASDASMSQL